MSRRDDVRQYLTVVFIILSVGCSHRYDQITSISPESITYSNDSLEEARSWPEDYSPSYGTKTIRVYFHFFNSLDSSLNFNADQGKIIVEQLIGAANLRLKSNARMNLPEGNNTAVYDSRLEYELSSFKGKPGLFYHYDKEPEFFIKNGKSANRYDRSIIKKCAIKEDSVINVFMLPFDPDQLESGEQRLERTAIALGHSIKIPGLFQSKRHPGDYAGMFNHEVGHILGLRHSWNTNDGCVDTPLNDNCWNRLEEPPCQGVTSNNLMDYNAFQSAITPCQIARMHAALSNPGLAASRLVKQNWCLPYEKNNIEISGEKRWSFPRRLTGDIIIKNGGIVYATSLIHMTSGSQIKIEKGGSLIIEGATFYNSCGESWKGIYYDRKSSMMIVGENNTLLNIDQK